MSGFQLDTSGAIRLVPAKSDPDGPIYRFSDLSPFAQGYVAALFASLPVSNVYCDDCPPDGYCTDATRCSECPRGIRFSRLSPEALALILKDCADMERVRERADMIADKAMGSSYWNWRQDGRLSSWRPLTISLSDDGKVRLAVAA